VLLDREGERFDLAPGGLERLQRRNRRRQRNRKMGAGVLAIAVAFSGTLLVVTAFQGRIPAPRPVERPRIVQTSATGVRPVGLAAGEGAVWVVSAADRALVRVDPATGSVVDEIAIREGVGPPIGVTVANGSVWVQTGYAERQAQTRHAERKRVVVVSAVVRVDPATNRVLSTLALDHASSAGIAVGGGAVWSVSSDTGVVSRRELPGGRLTATGRGPVRPVALAFGMKAVWFLGGGRANNQRAIPGTIARIDPASLSVISSTQIGPSPQDLALGNGAVWAVDAGDGAVVRIDPATVSITDRIPLPGLLTSISVSRRGVWVLDTTGGVLFRIDPNERTATGSVEVGPTPVAVSAEEEAVWVVRSDGTILRIES
jgi:streptogramin lyase